MKMIIRQALAKDLPSVKKILKPWTDLDPSLVEVLDGLVEGSARPMEGCCRVLEMDGAVACMSLWVHQGPNQVRLLAFAGRSPSGYSGLEVRFLREEIMDWAEMGIAKVSISVPEAVCSMILGTLRACGFMFEGLFSGFTPEKKPHAQLCKHLLYSTVSHTDLMGFLKECLLSLGCEIRSEGDGFGYRIRSEYLFPFIFSPWHRVTRSGPDIIVHPPARVIELHELETLFYPLGVRARNEKPLLVHIEKKAAAQMIDLPHLDPHQSTLFRGSELNRYRSVKINEFTYTAPAGPNAMRKGLPLLFYVNRVGAVGTARVENWYLDEPEILCGHLHEMAQFDPEDVKEHAAGSGPRAGKVLAIRFRWYRPLARVVSLDEIRQMDSGFNPQRTRSIAPRLFQSIISAGAGTEP